MTNTTNIRVLIVDDSVIYRSILSKIVETIPNAEIADTASNGKIAINKLAHISVDVVLLDIEMPVMNGLDALKIIQRLYPFIKVVIISSVNKGHALNTIKALELGAVDFIQKPEGTYVENFSILTEHLQHLFSHFHKQKSIRAIHRPLLPKTLPCTDAEPESASITLPTPATPITPKRILLPPKQIDVLAIGASTGGPNALMKLLPQLPADLGVPILLVQHMPEYFTSSLANSLDLKSSIPIKEAEDRETIKPNTLYLAPGGHHMIVKKIPSILSIEVSYRIEINNSPPVQNCRPSVDVLFQSIAECYGNNILAVVLTGMGCDGREGVRSMKQKGCYCLTQDELSCVVYGMPQCVFEAGLSDESVPLDRMAERIISLIQGL